MTTDPPPAAPQPQPPMTLPPRSGGKRQGIWATLGALMFAGILVAMAVYTGPAILSDWQIRNTAEPADGARLVKGSCSTKLIFAICDVTLSNRTKSGAITRDVNYVFTDVHFGDYRAGVLADPNRPELMTTDLGLDKLWNRTITFVVATIVLLIMVVMSIAGLVINRRKASAAQG